MTAEQYASHALVYTQMHAEGKMSTAYYIEAMRRITSEHVEARGYA